MQQKVKYLSRLVHFCAVCACMRRQSVEASFPSVFCYSSAPQEQPNNHSCNLPVTQSLSSSPRKTQTRSHLQSWFPQLRLKRLWFHVFGLSSWCLHQLLLWGNCCMTYRSLKCFLRSYPPLPSGAIPCNPIDMHLYKMDQAKRKGLTPIESCTCLDVYFFFCIYFPLLRMLLSLCWCHQLTGQHMKKETERELAPFSSVHPGWRIPCTAWGLPASTAKGAMWIKWIFGDEHDNDQTTAFIPYKQKYFCVTGPLKAYCLCVKDHK